MSGKSWDRNLSACGLIHCEGNIVNGTFKMSLYRRACGSVRLLQIVFRSFLVLACNRWGWSYNFPSIHPCISTSKGFKIYFFHQKHFLDSNQLNLKTSSLKLSLRIFSSSHPKLMKLIGISKTLWRRQKIPFWTFHKRRKENL